MLKPKEKGMSKRALKIERYTAEELASLLRKDEKFSQGIRLYACYQVALGKRPKELEQLYNTSFKSICNWVNRLNEGGIEALADKPRPGRTARLDAAQMSELKELLLHEQPEDHGYNSAVWSGPMVTDWIKKKWSISIKRAHVYNLIHALGFTHQKAKGIYPEARDREPAIEALKKTAKSKG